jgi:hypothetical protein
VGQPARFAWLQLLVTLVGLGGAALCALALTWDYFTGVSGFGWKRWLTVASGSLFVVAAVLVRSLQSSSPAEALRFLVILAEVALIYMVFRFYELESPLFHNFVLPLLVTGFVANYFLAVEYRPTFFLALSLGAMFAIFGLMAGAALLVIGLVLIGICHLPIPIWQRITLILVVGTVLALQRGGWMPAGGFEIILPFVGSIFMFRLALYLYDLHSGKGPGSLPMHLSYFFMLPNFAFPFFPVVDFATWGRTFQSEPKIETYQRGVVWLMIGTIHLLLYRLVNYYLAIDPTDVSGFGSFLYYSIMNFGLYLKISGLFHTILGGLFLFGFALPETHTRYYLSFSFIEFWRRINIYWKDFMQKMVFNPAFVRAKQFGVTHLQAIVLSMVAVFVVTWALHTYQWFWLLGSVHLTGPDFLFWGILCLLLVIQTVEEVRPPKRGAVARIGPRTLHIARTVATMLTIVILWSFWSSDSMADWWLLLSVSGVPLLASDAEWTVANLLSSAAFVAFLFIITAVALGYTFGLAPRGSHPRQKVLVKRNRKYPFDRLAAAVTVAAAALVLVQVPQVTGWFPVAIGNFVYDIGSTRLSARDQAKLERGYYENLTSTRMINSELWQLQNQVQDPGVWALLAQTDAVEFVEDYRRFVLRPNVSITFKDRPFSTNSLGIRDREYSLEKPAGVTRIGILGTSRALGYGVLDDETFENIIEDRLNARGVRVESLNFSVSAYDVVKKLMVLERQALPMSPDIVIFIAHERDIVLDYESLARVYERNALPFDFLAPLLEAAGIRPDLSQKEIEQRLQRYLPEIAARSYERLAVQVRAAGAVPVWVYLPSTEQYITPSEVSIVLRDLAAEAGFEIINLYDIYNGTDVQDFKVREGDLHPNAAGHRRIADWLETRLLANPVTGPLLSGE